jgi:hypothetical protein
MTIENEWTITIRVSPHRLIDEKWVGGRMQRFTIKTCGIDNAVEVGNAIRKGIESNPDVWMTTIEEIKLQE